jgi:hypothetical protein
MNSLDSTNQGPRIAWIGASTYPSWYTDINSHNFRIFENLPGSSTGQVMIYNAGANGSLGVYTQGLQINKAVATVNHILLTSDNIYRNNEPALGGGQVSIDFFMASYDAEKWRRCLDIRVRGQGDGTYGDSVIRFFTSSKSLNAAETEKMRITGDGKVGIGTTNPVNGILEVSGSVSNATAFWYFQFGQTNNLGPWAGGDNVSIYASNSIEAGQFNAISDKRIKSVIGTSNSSEDLKKLCDIQITDYKYIDPIKYGNKTHKKVIAQQVETVLSEAINLSQDFVPSVYELAKSTKKSGNGIKITTSKAHGFIKGDIVKILGNENKDFETVTVKEVVDNNSFVIDGDKVPEKLFIYGKRVDDFHTVDYDALTTLNISATQELVKQINQLKEKIIQLEQKLK